MHHDSDWNYVNRADQNRVPNLSRARFDYKRKDEDDMAKSTKTYEERIRALEKKEENKWQIENFRRIWQARGGL